MDVSSALRCATLRHKSLRSLKASTFVRLLSPSEARTPPRSPKSVAPKPHAPLAPRKSGGSKGRRPLDSRKSRDPKGRVPFGASKNAPLAGCQTPPHPHLDGGADGARALETADSKAARGH